MSEGLERFTDWIVQDGLGLVSGQFSHTGLGLWSSSLVDLISWVAVGEERCRGVVSTRGILAVLHW